MKHFLLSFATLLVALASYAEVIPAEFDTTPVTPPTGLETQDYEWTMYRDTSADGTQKEPIVSTVKVGYDGNDVYIQGTCAHFPEAWIKGEIQGDKLIFKSGQFYGDDVFMGIYLFFLAGDIQYILQESGSYNLQITGLDEMVFDYDAENKSFASTQYLINCVYNYCSPVEDIEFMGFYANPKAKPLAFKPTTPADPEISFLQEYNPESNMGFIGINMSQLGIDDEYMDPGYLFYNLYLDDELYVFNADVYYIPYDTSDMPYLFSNGENITRINSYFLLTVYQPFTKVGVKLNYAYEGGETIYSSNIVTRELSGIDNIASDDIQSVEYYNLNGVKVANPENGLFLKVARDSKGNSQASKVIMK